MYYFISRKTLNPHYATRRTAGVGPGLRATLNAAVTNNSHRSSAGALMSHMTAMWAASPAHASMKLLAAAVSQELTCGTFGTHHVVAGEALDTATMDSPPPIGCSPV